MLRPNDQLNMHIQCIVAVLLILCLPLVYGNERVGNEGQEIEKSIQLNITSQLGDNAVYVDGDVVSYFVSTSLDAYLVLIYRDASQNIVQLLPNLHDPRSFFKAGDFIEIPGMHASFVFQVSKPFGSEQVYMFASDQPFPSLRGERLKNGLLLLEHRSTDLILSIMREHGKNGSRFYGEAKTSITTAERLF